PAAIASHSPYVEVLKEEVLALLAPISPRSGEIPFYSTVTGGVLDTAKLDAGYWYRNLREPVQFEQVTRGLLADGHRVLIEISPHPVFALAVRETIEEALPGSEQATVLGTLRREEGGSERFSLSLAEAHAAGAKLDWEAFFEGSGAKRVALPTYAFQRKRFWLSAVAGSGDPSAIGQSDAGHPLLGAAVELAGGEGDGLLFTGRLSLASHPWLADHALAGTVLLPGTAFVELALRAGEQVEAQTLEELALQAPLILPQQGAVALQVSVGGPDEEGRREVSIHSRPDGGEEGWSCHAQGLLSPQATAAVASLEAWPPKGAEPLEVDYLYDRLAEAGFEYGPAFQGLTAAWRDAEAIYAEISLSEEQASDARRFGIHPALLDSALHTAFLGSGPEGARDRPLGLPFAWSDVSLHATGATELRVRVEVKGEDGMSLVAADQGGAVVAEVGSLRLRPLDAAQLQGAGSRQDGLLGLRWQHVPLAEAAASEGVEAPEVVHVEPLLDPAAALPDAARASTGAVLELIQGWLRREPLPDSRLVLVTRGAVAAKEGESPDLAVAPVWGLLRSAQSEHPGRFTLIDTDGSEASMEALPALDIEEEPQIALREGAALVPRAIPMPARSDGEEEAAPSFDPDSTVLVTGATGALGGVVARHLAAEHGARHLLLISRSGEEAEGAAELRAALEELGAEVRIEACDASSREQLSAAIDSISKEHPLGAIVHSAGTLDDGTIETLGPEQIGHVFAPKADAAHHLHELSAGMDLSAFVMFSSLAGAIGNPGQGNYAAANVFLDALAARRRAEGLPATSIAWGLWAETSKVDAADMARMQRGGIAALSNEQGLALFDAALAAEAPLTLAAPFDRAALGAMASVGMLPPLLSGLVRVPKRRRSAAAGSVAAKLATLPEAERADFVLELVRGETAAVLGHASAAEVEPEKAFKDLGFDSLAAVELRNRLGVVTGLRLPATLVFDYPSAAALAGYLAGELSAGIGAAAGATSADDPFVQPGKQGNGGFSAELKPLIQRAQGEARPDELLRLLTAFGSLRPSFEERLDVDAAPKPVRLSEGSAGIPMFCFATAAFTSGVHEYTAFAEEFQGMREVTALPQSGFGPGELVPATLGAAVETHAETVRRLAGDRRFVLVGHSTGGLFAHSVAQRLDEMGIPPAAVVALDSYRADQPEQDDVLGPILKALQSLGGEDEVMSTTRMTAMGVYGRLLFEWKLRDAASPTLLVRAGDPVPGVAPDANWQCSWGLDDEVDVPGNHVTLMQPEHVGTTARAVEAWLTETVDDGTTDAVALAGR
ncbi:MAG TPA: SDR family NAD(P)-dependent oxidoreductase, partial [Solirubrobacterales bacterium]|nr:SDR family NAD(P)-dependent oxidoreductase [Solirubrobacterales bacterium]